MKISVVVNIYNCESYIHKCIDSILSQTYEDYELLLIDNGSTDKSKIICDEYTMKDLRVKSIHLETFSGVANGFKKGICEAEGDYITFLNGETYLDRYFLAKMSKAITTYNADFLFCDCVKHNGSRNIRTHSSSLENGVYEKARILTEILPKMFSDITIPFTQVINTEYKAKMYHTPLVKNIIDFFELKQYNDWENLITLYILNNCNKMVYLRNEYLYYYKAPDVPIDLYWNKSINYYNISEFIAKENKQAANLMNSFKSNIISGYMDYLIRNINTSEKNIIKNELKNIAESDIFNTFTINNDLYISKLQKLYYILLKKKWYSVLYLLMQYVSKKQTNRI